MNSFGGRDQLENQNPLSNRSTFAEIPYQIPKKGTEIPFMNKIIQIEQDILSIINVNTLWFLVNFFLQIS